MPKKRKTRKSKSYQRGSLIKAIYTYFKKVGISNIKYDKCLALAKKIKPNTKFNHYHLAWYKNDYQNKEDRLLTLYGIK